MHAFNLDMFRIIFVCVCAKGSMLTNSAPGLGHVLFNAFIFLSLGEGQRQFQWVGGAQGKPFAMQFVCSGAWGGLWSFFGLRVR